MSAFVWARDRKAASNWDGARFTPFLSMDRKYLPNRVVSEVLALSKSFTFLSVKKQVNIEPTLLNVVDTPASAAAVLSPCSRSAAFFSSVL